MNTNNLLITGSTSALARSLIRVAAQKKEYRVLSVSRSDPPMQQYSDGLKDFKELSEIDFTNEMHLESLAECVQDFFKERFNVIHFAGDFWRHKPLVCTEFTEIQSMINSHYVSLCGVAKATTPLMMKYGGGRLVAFTCNSVSYSYPDMSPFTASKAAVESFIKCYSNEQAPNGISATAIALPTMRTDKILIEKPNGDHENYIEPDKLSIFILDHVLTQPPIATGNIMRLVSASPTFYGMGYFERNPRKEEHNDAMQPTASVAAAPSASGDGYRSAEETMT